MLETNSKLWSDLIDSTKQWDDKHSTLPPIQLPPIQVPLPSFFDHAHSPSHHHHSYNEPMMSPSSPTSPTLSSSLTTPTSISFNNSPLKDLQQQPITLSTSTSTSSSTSSSSSSSSSSSPIISKIHMETLCLDHFDKPRRGNLPKPVTAILKKWLIEHCRNPYPTEEEKQQLKRETQLTLNQISNWFINARRRTLPIILAKLNQQYPGIKARRRRRKRSEKTMNNNGQ
ncbi:homeobox KN domain-containing protein [Cunninghamella echinulata]|nr:homeobox KN domain-containing protein [Cunninghamella echinulata]